MGTSILCMCARVSVFPMVKKIFEPPERPPRADVTIDPIDHIMPTYQFPVQPN